MSLLKQEQSGIVFEQVVLICPHDNSFRSIIWTRKVINSFMENDFILFIYLFGVYFVQTCIVSLGIVVIRVQTFNQMFPK
jgi:hypothetical protein